MVSQICKHMKREEDRIFYFLGKLLGVLLLVLLITIPVLGPEWLFLFPDCAFYQKTGLYCPGCGGTRAVAALLTGHPLKSLWYHPFLLYATAVYLWFMGTCFLQKHVPAVKLPAIRLERWIYVGVGIILAQWAVKDLALLLAGVRWM